MRDSYDVVIENLVRFVTDEGARLVKEKAVSAALRIIQGVRRIFIIHYVIMFLCFLSALSFFASSYLIFDATVVRSQAFTTLLSVKPLLFCLALFLFSSTLLAFSVRESAWVKASGLATVYEMRPSHSYLDDESRLVEVVESIIDKKLSAAPRKKKRRRAS